MNLTNSNSFQSKKQVVEIQKNLEILIFFFINNFHKEKANTSNHFYSENASNRATLHKFATTQCPRAKCFFLIWPWHREICKLNLIWSYLCTHRTQSAGINVQSPQSATTPRRLTLNLAWLLNLFVKIFPPDYLIDPVW